jgi:hypothetical protein
MCWGCAGRGYDLDVQSVELPPFRTIINDYYTCLGYVLTNSHNGLRIRLTIHFLCFWVQYCSGCCPVDNICVFREIRVHFTCKSSVVLNAQTPARVCPSRIGCTACQYARSRTDGGERGVIKAG